MTPIIEVRNIAKEYLLGEAAQMYGSFRETLKQAVRKPWKAVTTGLGSSNGNGNGKREAFWALRDVSFDVETGETVGIVGANGAGKSTLLKILSRITDPTEGSVTVRGQIASLLEVGSGFHPELTGRENIFLNGAILGMHKAEIEAKFEEIVNFAGIGRFLDTPVKRYSSGMYVRLAFSVAAHLDPEILIVDEVLAVGDIAFQKKCLGKMEEACTRSRTVLFVSHNLAAVESLCGRVIVLQHGAVVFNGATKEGLEHYLQSLSSNDARSRSHIADLNSAAGRPEKFRPLLKRLELYTGDGKPLLGDLPTGAPLRARICFDLEEPCEGFDVVLGFDTLSGQHICVAHSSCEAKRVHEQKVGEQAFVCEIPSLPLVPGEYRVTVTLQISRKRADFVNDAARLTVVKTDYFGTGFLPRHGVVLIQNRWTLENCEATVGVAAVNKPREDRWGVIP